MAETELLSCESAAWGSLELADAPRLPPSASQELTSSADRPLPAAGASVVVVGAGPAGLLAAHVLARRHGCRVQVFDRRSHPGALGTTADDEDRAFAIAMNVRGAGAVAAAGLDVAAFTASGDMCEVRDTLLARGDSLARAMVVPFAQPRIVGSRQAFVRALLHQVEAQEAAAAAASTAKAKASSGSGSIAFHWGTAFESADLAARTATLQLADGGTTTVKYDLLVAADGYWSKVRRAAEAQAPELQVGLLPPNRQYKTVRGLKPHASLPIGPTPDGGPGRLSMVQEAPGAGTPPGNIFFSQPSEATGVTAVLTMPHARWQGLEGADAGAYRTLLAAGYPSLPDSWRDEMAEQLAAKSLYETGMQVHASQLHAPGLVLLGDAAHAVSPATSNGMNSALEDAWVLSQTLEACSGDLGALPPRYTAARLEDARALLWLDTAMGVMAGRGGGAALKASVVARVLLNKATGGRLGQHAFVQFKDGSLAYAAARRSVERDAALARTLGGGAAAAAVAAVAAALAAAHRSR